MHRESAPSLHVSDIASSMVPAAGDHVVSVSAVAVHPQRTNDARPTKASRLVRHLIASPMFRRATPIKGATCSDGCSWTSAGSAGSWHHTNPAPLALSMIRWASRVIRRAVAEPASSIVGTLNRMISVRTRWVVECLKASEPRSRGSSRFVGTPAAARASSLRPSAKLDLAGSRFSATTHCDARSFTSPTDLER